MRKIEEDISPCSEVTLWVFAQNQRAIGFYRKLGYEFDGAEKTVQFGGVSLSEVRLRKTAPNQAPEPTAPSGRGSS
jgi:RimJ/RimL family protein N-acetyltransferase